MPHLTRYVYSRTLLASPAIQGGKDANKFEAAARPHGHEKETATDRRVKATGEKDAA